MYKNNVYLEMKRRKGKKKRKRCFGRQLDSFSCKIITREFRNHRNRKADGRKKTASKQIRPAFFIRET